jgi:hypothetical protein
MTNEQLAQIEARLKARTPGQWRYEPQLNAVFAGPGIDDNWVCGELYEDGDRTFIAAAPDDIAALVADNRAQRELLANMAINEHRVWDEDGECLFCGVKLGHAPGCVWAAARKALEG